MELDYVAVSFPRYGSDIDEARTLLHAAGSDAWIIAKIERAEAVADDEALDALIRASDGVMGRVATWAWKWATPSWWASRSASSSTRAR